MNPTEKLDLDALLLRWPAPQRDEQAWEDRAELIMSAALKAAGSSEPLPALFEAPPLAAEQGEPQASIASAGEKKMSQESDPTAPKTESIPPSAAPSTTSPARSSDRKRGSLKEMAARASQAGAASRPAPASTSTSTSTLTPLPSARPSATASPLPASSAASSPARPKEAGKEDSGIVNLASIKSAATAEEKAAAEKAKPATEGIFDEEEKKSGDAKVVPIASAKAADDGSKKKGTSGVVVGGVIAILGLAAAFAITKVNKPTTPPPAPVAAEVKQAAPDQKVEAAPAADSKAPVAQASAEPAPSAQASAEPQKVASATQSGSPAAGATPPGGAASAEPNADKTDTSASKPATAAAPDTTSKPGDLKGAMAQAVGSDGSSKTAATSDNAEPASGPRNQNIPEKPPQGSVQAAIRSVIGDAKACVAGADDISHANVTFSSNGSVSSVSVSGWAASHSQTGCIKNAMKGAKVGPFSSSSFSVAVPIRP